MDTFPYRHLKDEPPREIVLFDRYDPKINVVYDAMPNAPIINSGGKISPALPIKMLGLIIPFLTILGNSIYVPLLFIQ